MSKLSELKSSCNQNAVKPSNKIERMEIALKVIYTWSRFSELDTDAVNKLCAEALGIEE